MPNYEQPTERLDAQARGDGDRAWLRVRSRPDPSQLQIGELADAQNVRLDTYTAKVRGGVKYLEGGPNLLLNVPLVVPFTVGSDAVIVNVGSEGIFCVAEYAWPVQDYARYLALFTNDRCYLFRPETEDLQQVFYDSGELLVEGDGCDAVAANGKLYLARGNDKSVLVWDGVLANTFDPVPSGAHPSGGTLVRMPNVQWMLWARRRMVLPYGRYEIILSDAGDPDTYDTQWRQFRTAYGTADELVGAVEFRDDQLVVGYRNSMHLVTGLSSLGALSYGNVEMVQITNEAGVAARRSLVVFGERVFWVSSRGVYGLYITDEIKVRGLGKPLSDDVDWFADVNWEAISTAYAFIDGEERIGFVLPVDGALRPNAIYWYSFLNEDANGRGGWECVDRFANDFYLDYVGRIDIAGESRMVVVSRAAGVYVLNEPGQDWDEVKGLGASATLWQVPIAWQLVTREYRPWDPDVGVFSEGSVVAELEDGAAMTVQAISNDTDATRQVYSGTGAAGDVHALRRFVVRLRGLGLQLQIDGTGGARVRGSTVYARRVSKRAGWKA